ncbi:hypothetical protein BN7_622 [Wickerhamomyces ciferrii]|uniref:Uncharacterized protein n=1 Tax=Wickerhamomyces ciferrii (strain ATCC 14091 / BCRC 22168 / CBS 111 / JCM 3599 / NBRC 0793 / NRRL Y-1031 F-60-10) TaxID=1206466 RepID=K0K8C0_WICCF|nr:uncharacterized protein BN7_622 [Wickerhamomyces ciferrii]CCH41085.1 hypothetical protein BN7_622 [Wickerhamomyces ciferrii]
MFDKEAQNDKIKVNEEEITADGETSEEGSTRNDAGEESTTNSAEEESITDEISSEMTNENISEPIMENEITIESNITDDVKTEEKSKLRFIRNPHYDSKLTPKWYDIRSIKELINILESEQFEKRKYLVVDSYLANVAIDLSFLEGLRETCKCAVNIYKGDQFREVHIYTGCIYHKKKKRVSKFCDKFGKPIEYCIYCVPKGLDFENDPPPAGTFREYFMFHLTLKDDNDQTSINRITSFSEFTENVLLPYEALSASNIMAGLDEEGSKLLEKGGVVETRLSSKFNFSVKTTKSYYKAENGELLYGPSHVVEHIEIVE